MIIKHDFTGLNTVHCIRKSTKRMCMISTPVLCVTDQNYIMHLKFAISGGFCFLKYMVTMFVLAYHLHESNKLIRTQIQNTGKKY